MSGSVLPVQPREGVVFPAKDGRYGPTAYVLASNVPKAMRVIEEMVGFGTPAEPHP